MSLEASLRRRLSPAFALDVELRIAAGITILFGASGSGKSTLLRCLAGLSRPDSGRIAIDGRVVLDRNGGIDVPPQRRRVGVVFQQLALFPHLTVADNMAYGLRDLPGGERRRRVAAIAAAFHIDALLDRRPARLSGGERQRVALARTLVTEPALLLLDEPLSALDHRIQTQIINDLRAWNDARRIPVLYVTHAHREVYALGTHVIVMHDGRITASGAPYDVLEHPAHDDLAQLAGFENLVRAHVASRDPGGGTMHVALEAGGSLEVPLSPAPVAAPLTVAIRAGDILVATAPPQHLSARNVLPGTVQRLAREGPTVVADVLADAGTPFLVHLTPGGAASLGLAPGAAVWLIIKTYSCRLAAR